MNQATFKNFLNSKLVYRWNMFQFAEDILWHNESKLKVWRHFLGFDLSSEFKWPVAVETVFLWTREACAKATKNTLIVQATIKNRSMQAQRTNVRDDNTWSRDLISPFFLLMFLFLSFFSSFLSCLSPTVLTTWNLF